MEGVRKTADDHIAPEHAALRPGRPLGRSSAMAVVLTAACLAAGPAAFAQSSVAGSVSDETGGVMPGVTVEAASEALIEQSRVAFTDGQGRYAIEALRPGLYTITFTLPGFRTVVREGVEVVAGVSVPINARLAVGALEETVTVSGATPVVDVQQATQRSVIDRETIQALPTNRTTHTVGKILPGMKMTGSMLGGGGSTIVQQYMTARGKSSAQNTSQIDGIDTQMITGGGNLPYDNIGMTQEVSIETNPTTAETAGGGIRINMIPKEGSNDFSGDLYFSGMVGDWQADNITDELRAIGATTPSSTENMFDLNPAFGGRMVRDRLWFYVSGRVNHARLGPAGASYFSPDPETGQLLPDLSRPGFNDTATDNASFRLTWQASRNHKITSYRDQFWRYQSHSFGSAATDWATVPMVYSRGAQYVWPTKWTYTATNRLLVEAGFQHWHYDNALLTPQPGTHFEPPAAFGGRPETQTTPWYANAGQVHLPGNYTTKALDFGYCCRTSEVPAYVYAASLAYVTGSHSFKAGLTGRWGHEQTSRQAHNGSLVQWYLGGSPFRVRVSPDPSDIRLEVNRDIGLFVQDQWTRGRFTFNAGVRVEHFKGGVGDGSSNAGRFVPPRSVDAINVWNFTDVLPRFSVVWDLLGNARTALKLSAGRYVAALGVRGLRPYSPLRRIGEYRSWFDRDLDGRELPTNGDDIAQDNEIVPSSDPLFGLRAARRADPDLQREDSWDFSLGIQQELAAGLSLNLVHYYSDEGRLWALRDSGLSPGDYRGFEVANPLNPSEMIPVYDLIPGTEIGDVVEVSSNVNKRSYHGFEVSLQGRLASGGAVMAGWYTDRQLATDCDTHDPNRFRFCDETGELFQDHGVVEAIPFRHEFKFAMSHDLPVGLEGAVSFISYPGAGSPPANPLTPASNVDPRWSDVAYPVPDHLFPDGRPTVPIDDVLLLAPGTRYLDRWNQVDLSIKRRFRAGGMDVLPSLDLFNVGNSSPVLAEVETYGSAGIPLTILGGRMMRLGVLVLF